MSKHFHSAKLIWRDLQTAPCELHLDTLKCGQTFRWRQTDDLWSCVLNGRLYTLKQTPSTVLYGVFPDQDESAMRATLRDYFQLDRVSLEACYRRWSQLDVNFKAKAGYFEGIRILRQDPWENLVAFICSSNNNIARISQMVQKLCVHYGPAVATLDGVAYHDFPTIDALAQDGVEEKLRELGFGYRAKYIAQTASQVKENSAEWLWNLRKAPYSEAKEALMSLSGVGPKVADCVCLMSLDHPEAIPVDTHVWQIALRDYGFGKKGKSLTAKLYDQVGDHFRNLFGEYSGWAHSVLFTADLRAFESRLRVAKETNVVVKKEGTKDTAVTEEKVTMEATLKKRGREVIKTEETTVSLRRSTRSKKAKPL
ncbi:DNA glycosylase [Fennellomyces sp. T-0311]|nr:DNA glycosylase [Fennellomyces sp. T-0311]